MVQFRVGRTRTLGSPGSPLAGRSRGIEVPVRILLIPSFNPGGVCDFEGRARVFNQLVSGP